MKKHPFLIFLFFLAACAPATASPLAPTAERTPVPGAAALLATPKALPTAVAMGYEVASDGLTITVQTVEQNNSYMTEYGTTRDAGAGIQFLWVQLSLETAYNNGTAYPEADHFSALYAGEEFKPTYGHREGFPDYTSLTGLLFPGSPKQAWLRFDLPASAGLEDIRFAFLPESTRVTTSRSQSDNSYYDHPVYLWRLTDN